MPSPSHSTLIFWEINKLETTKGHNIKWEKERRNLHKVKSRRGGKSDKKI